MATNRLSYGTADGSNSAAIVVVTKLVLWIRVVLEKLTGTQPIESLIGFIYFSLF
jgi:hypothetical protein